jgi:hypothetical protein
MKHGELAARNRPGGHWVAATQPEAADHAVTGSVELERLTRVGLLSDGAARLVEMFGVTDWPDFLDRVGAQGTQAVISQVRELEESDPVGRRWPRNKARDDATIVLALL